MPTIITDLAGLKQLGKEYLDALPTATPEELAAGWNCFSLAYLGAKLPSRVDEIQATALFNIVSKKMLARQQEQEAAASSGSPPPA